MVLLRQKSYVEPPSWAPLPALLLIALFVTSLTHEWIAGKFYSIEASFWHCTEPSFFLCKDEGGRSGIAFIRPTLNFLIMRNLPFGSASKACAEFRFRPTRLP